MDLTHGNISKKLIQFTLPIIIMQILNQAYCIADSVIVSQFAGERALSIISSTTAVLVVGYCLINGATGACHILVGNQFGKKDYEKIKDTIQTILISGTVFSLILALIYILFSHIFFEMVALPEEILNESIVLLRIYSLSFVVQIICSIQMSILNGMGNSKTPMITCISTQILNIVLDYIAVAIFNYGVIGAALASVFSLTVSTIWNSIEVNRHLSIYTTYVGKFDLTIFKQYIQLTIPSMLQQSVMSIGSLFLQRLVNVQGIDAINGYTVACNLNSFLIIPVISYTNAYETFASQNVGSCDEIRVKEGFKCVLIQCSGLCILLSILTILLAKPMIMMYLKDVNSDSFQFAYWYLIILIPNFFALLLKYGVDALFKAHMKIYLFTISSLIALFGRIVFSYLFVHQFGLIVIAYATLIGNILAILFNWSMKSILKY